MENIPIIFADFFKLHYSFYDFMITFGTADEDRTHLLGKVKMSPQMAKELSIYLQKQVQQYEKQFGKIKLPLEIEKQKNNKQKTEMSSQ